jgi:opacity protein-like surface antigen
MGPTRVPDMRSVGRLCCLSLLCATATCPADPDALGLYVGAGVGQSTLKQDYYQVNSHVTGWKLEAGWHPIPFLGADVEYVDLGSKNVTYTSPGGTTSLSTSARAPAVFVVGYLPVPAPWLGLYGKFGAARVQSKTDGRQGPPCSTGFECPAVIAPISSDVTSTKFAWGAGAEFKFGLPGIRVEYERLNGPQGDNALLSVAATLNF